MVIVGLVMTAGALALLMGLGIAVIALLLKKIARPEK